LKNGLADPDPLVRLGAVRGAASYRDEELRALLSDLVRDPRRAVRSEAARLLAPVPDPAWSAEQRLAVELALDEWLAAEQAAAERPESQFNIGALRAELGKAGDAEAAFKEALAQDPRFTSAALNLADLYRSLNREEESEKVLRDAVALAPDDADAHYALGLALVRRRHRDEALVEIEKAATLKPEDVRFIYTFGLALAESGNQSRALAVLDEAHRRFPDDRDLLVALVALARQAGDVARALQYAQSLAVIDNAGGAN
jgi:tetratricopeptide (TPR) repeat protein